jgi:hypothetical protein
MVEKNNKIFEVIDNDLLPLTYLCRMRNVLLEEAWNTAKKLEYGKSVVIKCKDRKEFNSFGASLVYRRKNENVPEIRIIRIMALLKIILQKKFYIKDKED